MGTNREAYEGVNMDNRVVGFLEARHLRNKNRSLYIALEEVNFVWPRQHVKEFQKMWRKGFSMQHISEYFERPMIEVALLVMSREMDGNIKPRK